MADAAKKNDMFLPFVEGSPQGARSGTHLPCYNPQFEKCYRMCENILAKHVDEVAHLSLKWEWLLDDYGNKAQAVPLLDIQFKF